MSQDTRLKHRVAEYLADVLRVVAAERATDITELHDAEVELVTNLLIQLRTNPGSGESRIIEIKVSEPVA